MSNTDNTAASAANPADSDLFYIVNLSHLQREQRYVTVWRPECFGYAWPLSWAGRYTRAEVMAKLDYFNSGRNVAVPCAVLDALAVDPAPGIIDGNKGPVVPSNKETWKLIMDNVIAPPAELMKPVYPGAPGKKDMAYSVPVKVAAAM